MPAAPRDVLPTSEMAWRLQEMRMGTVLDSAGIASGFPDP